VKRIIWTILLGVMPFAIFAFAAWDADPRAWSMFARGYCAVCSFGLAIAAYTAPRSSK